MANKKKKEKIIYIDDGRTIADMSGVSRGLKGPKKETKKKVPYTPRNLTGRGTLRDQWETYKNAVKMMFVPMLVVLAAIFLIFLVLGLLFSAA